MDLYHLLAFIFFFQLVEKCEPRPTEQLPSQTAMSFMRKFGYLEEVGQDAENLYKEETITQAIKTMQKFGGLPQTGIIDNATTQLFTKPRCGVPDTARIHKSNRTKRYIIGADGWKKREITYYLANWSPKLGDWQRVQDQLKKAFDLWGDYSRLRFLHVNRADADIVVFFAQGPHGDGYPMDGPGNILAHAFYPYEHDSFGGDIHFDEDEDWIMGSGDGFDFFTVAAHEIGHSLGLAHSPVGSSLMFPYYKGHSTHFQLDYDDILAVYQLYVSKPLEDETITFQDDVEGNDRNADDTEDEKSTEDDDNEDETSTEDVDGKSVEEDDNDVGDASEEQTATSSEIEESIDVEEPDSSHEDETTVTTNTKPIPNLCEGSYDTIATLRNDLFVFKDEWVWRFRDRGDLQEGYPATIQQFFRFPIANVNKIDAAFERPSDNILILFTGSVFWLYDGDKITNRRIPLPLLSLGLPTDLDSLDAAFVWGKNGKTYFFRDGIYWRYNDTLRKMDDGYPLPMSRWRGVPSHIDTAFQWTDGKTYFFVGKDFYRFNDEEVIVDRQYPLSATEFWFGCPKEVP